MKRHSESMLLVWRIAELEARNLGADTIQPAHFFLGLLKVVEVNLSRLLRNHKDLDLPQIENDVAKLKECLGEYVLDITYTRRFLRGIMPRKSESQEVIAERLRRSAASRELFKSIETAAAKTKSPVLPLHLLYELVISDSVQIQTALLKVNVDPVNFAKYVSAKIKKSRAS